MPRHGWIWRDFGTLNKFRKYGLRGEWYKPAPLRINSQKKNWISPFNIEKPKPMKLGWSIPMKAVNRSYQNMRIDRNRWKAIQQRREKQLFYLRTKTRPKYVIKTRK